MSPEMSLEEMAAKLIARHILVNDLVTGAKYESRWTNRGDTVRGRFTLVTPDTFWTGAYIPLLVTQEAERREQNLAPATAYELAAFACEGWDGQSLVVAGGSTYHGSGGFGNESEQQAGLYSFRSLGRTRWSLALLPLTYSHTEHNILCVVLV